MLIKGMTESSVIPFLTSFVLQIPQMHINRVCFSFPRLLKPLVVNMGKMYNYKGEAKPWLIWSVIDARKRIKKMTLSLMGH